MLNSSSVSMMTAVNFWDPAADRSEEESAVKFDEFKPVVNNDKGLTWEFTELSNSAFFGLDTDNHA